MYPYHPSVAAPISPMELLCPSWVFKRSAISLYLKRGSNSHSRRNLILNYIGSLCGQRWIWTTVGVSQQIYSLPHLTTLVSTHYFTEREINSPILSFLKIFGGPSLTVSLLCRVITLLTKNFCGIGRFRTYNLWINSPLLCHWATIPLLIIILRRKWDSNPRDGVITVLTDFKSVPFKHLGIPPLLGIQSCRLTTLQIYDYKY